MPRWFNNFLLCLVSSAAIRSTCSSMLIARFVISSKFPIGVATMYRLPDKRTLLNFIKNDSRNSKLYVTQYTHENFDNFTIENKYATKVIIFNKLNKNFKDKFIKNNFYETVMSATVHFSEPKANIQVPKQRIMPRLQAIPQAPISSEISVHIADRQQPFSLLSRHRT